jgi:Ion channel
VRALWTVVPGIIVIAFAVREMFQDLFHPSESGSLSGWIGKTAFRLLRCWPRRLTLAGPLALALVILCWALLLATGFALIYWANLPGNFRSDDGRSDFWTAFYFSLQSMTTLGLGDIKPLPTWLRLLAAFQTLVGMAFITASVTWTVLIFPALARVRSLARRASTLALAEQQTGVEVASEPLIASELAGRVTRMRVDLIHYPIIYYFRAEDENASMAHAAGHIARFARRAMEPWRPGSVKLAGAALNASLNDIAKILAERYDVDSDDRDAVFKAYAEDHAVRLAS